MRPTIRSSRSLESSFFHARCQAISYLAAPSVMEVMAASARRGCRRPGATKGSAATAAPDPADKAEFGAGIALQRSDFFEAGALKLRKGFTDKPSNGEEQSDPGSGVRGRRFRRGASASCENRGRRTPGAAGRWFTTAGCSKRRRMPQGICFRSGNDGACAGFHQPQEFFSSCCRSIPIFLR